MPTTINGVEYELVPGANLDDADLHGADLRGLDLSDASFRRANLRGARLNMANVSEADFRSADLTEANFTSADCSNARFGSTVRRRWTIDGADMTDAEVPCDECECVECECRHCLRCGQTTESPCEQCDRGSCCCACSHCDSCGDACESTCSQCGDCDSCCEGHETFEESNPYKIHHDGTKRLAGVEYETTEAPSNNGHAWAETWGAGWHEDGSCGYEAVTPPCAGKHIDACLTELANVIGPTDKRCGIHVHVDAGDYRWADMYRFLAVWSRIEGLMYVLGGQHRATNTYCEPCGDNYKKALASSDSKNAILSLAYGCRETTEVAIKGRYVQVPAGKQYNRNHPTKKTSGRYKSVNIAPWVFGRRLAKHIRPDTTIEFRLHRNGDGAERVIGWTHLCVAIVDWCAKASEAEVAKLPKNALRALCRIAPGSQAWILQRVREWRTVTKCDSGVARRIDARTWTIKTDPRLRRTLPAIPPAPDAPQGCQCEACVSYRAGLAASNEAALAVSNEATFLQRSA